MELFLLLDFPLSLSLLNNVFNIFTIPTLKPRVGANWT